MIKKLCILLLSASIVAPLAAQQYGNQEDHASFAPRKGLWQVSMVLGNGTFFNDSEIQSLVPS